MLNMTDYTLMKMKQLYYAQDKFVHFHIRCRVGN